MAMSRADYESVAINMGLIYRQNEPKGEAYAMWRAMQDAFVDAARHSNPRFDEVKFKTFCAEVASGDRDVDGKRVKR